MSDSQRRVLYMMGLVLGTLLFAYQVWKGYLGISQASFPTSAFSYLLVAWTLSGLALGLQAIAWRVLMQELRVDLTWRSVVKGYMLSFLPRYIPGSVWGYLSRGEWLRSSHGVSYTVSHLGSVLEVLVALVTGGTVIGAYYVVVSDGARRWAVFALLLGVLVGGWLILYTLYRSQIVGEFMSRRMRYRVLLTLNRRRWIKVFLIYHLLWLCYGGQVLVIARMFTQVLGVEGLLPASGMFAIAWLLGFTVVFLPSGLGVREVALAHLLSTSIGLASSYSSAISVMSRFSISLAEMFWLLVGTLLNRLDLRATRPAKEVDNSN